MGPVLERRSNIFTYNLLPRVVTDHSVEMCYLPSLVTFEVKDFTATELLLHDVSLLKCFYWHRQHFLCRNDSIQSGFCENNDRYFIISQ